MVDDVDLWLIQSLIESKIGSSGQHYVLGEDPNFFLNYVIGTAPLIQVLQERRFDVFIVDKGLPDLFTLTGFSQPAICYHIGYVGKFIKFRTFIMDDPDKDTINRYGIANLFEYLSALYLHADNSAFATTCLLQSIIETPSRTTDKEMYDRCNFLLHSSLYHERLVEAVSFTLLYFGLAHEMGHTYADDSLEIGAKVHPRELSDEAITQAVIESAKSIFEEIKVAGFNFK